MALATLSIDIEARLARLEEGLDKAARINAKAAQSVKSEWEDSAKEIKKVLGPLTAAFSVEALRRFTLGNAQAVDSLNDIADATGSTVESISALQDVATRTGTSIEVVDTALIKLNQALSAAKPDSDQANALKAIGLSAAELKKLDPAEALRRVAVALNGYADDGNKARLVQELFGKSLREVAPLLKDLASQTQLVGSITKEQAEQAERFVHALGQYETAAARARQAFVVSILPALTDFIERVNAATAAHGGFLTALAKQNPLENMPINPVEGVIKYREELTKLQAVIDKAGSARQGTPLADKLAIDANSAKARIKDVKEFIDFYERLLKLKDNADNSGAPPAIGGSVGALPLGGEKKLTEAQKFLEALQKQTIAELDLTKVEEAQLALSEKLVGASKREREAILELSRGLDLLKQKRTEDPRTAFRRSELDAQPKDSEFFNFQAKQAEETQKAVASLIAQTKQGQIDALAKQYGQLAAEQARGAITAKQYVDALDLLDEQFTKITEPAKQAAQEMSEFAKQAQRNIQDALGDSLLNGLKGNFDSIGELWTDLLQRMVAQALAAQLNEALFGKPGKDGTAGTAGLLTDLFKFFGGSFAVGSESVPRDMLAFVHQGERIVPAHQNRGGSSGGTTIHQTIDARGNNDRAGVARLAASVKAATLAAVADARIRGNPAFS